MFKKNEINGISYYCSDIFNSDKLTNLFTTRELDNKTDLYQSFSLGIGGQSVLNEIVKSNRQKICSEFNLDFNKLIIPDQKHTDNIKFVTSLNDDISNTDAVITNVKQLPVMLLFADCVPLILYSEKDNVLAVVHAGWRGTAQKIASKTVARMGDFCNVMPENIKVAIGQAIGICCYEVSKEVKDFLVETVSFACDSIIYANNDKFFVDLKQFNKLQLMEAGVSQIDIFDICTSCNKDEFFSYRAENGKTGRHGAIACLK